VSQSLANILLHIIFSTKQRVPSLATHDVREAMNGYLVGTLRNLGCPSIIVGCARDHVHILCNLSRTLTVAQLLEETKKSSSVWIKTQNEALREFHWQGGYGAFSVSQSNVEAVTRYIAGQEQHHRTMSFQDEFRLFLKRHGVTFDERYVWD
jgi:putative transposase